MNSSYDSKRGCQCNMCKITLHIAGKTDVLYEVAHIRSPLHDYNSIKDFASIQYFIASLEKETLY